MDRRLLVLSILLFEAFANVYSSPTIISADLNEVNQDLVFANVVSSIKSICFYTFFEMKISFFKRVVLIFCSFDRFIAMATEI